MEFLVILLLIGLNGLFSMAETAVIAARRARLQQQAEKGSQGAQTALELAQEPNRFLSTVQVGITLIGILTGAFGGATIAAQIAGLVRPTALGRYADAIGFGVVVVVTTYLSLIVGELVPKRLALLYPERIAAVIARPMNTLSALTSPLITLLSGSTSAVMFLLGVSQGDEPPVTEEEIKTMMRQGSEAGVFEEGEPEMVSGIFRLGERRVGSVMTPRTEVYWLNVNDSDEENRAKIRDCDFSRMPVCADDMDHVVGLMNAKALLSRLLAGESFDLHATMTEPLFVPENLPASKALSLFRESAQHIALVVGEYGGMEGLITMQDLLEEIVGDDENSAPQAVGREDGSMLIDGLMAIDDFEALFNVIVPGAHDDYATLGGFVMAQMGTIPQAGESFDWENLHVEVMDMDGNRVDKVLVTAQEPAPDASSDEPTDELAEAPAAAPADTPTGDS